MREESNNSDAMEHKRCNEISLNDFRIYYVSNWKKASIYLANKKNEQGYSFCSKSQHKMYAQKI